jgi:hypothetical protein
MTLKYRKTLDKVGVRLVVKTSRRSSMRQIGNLYGYLESIINLASMEQETRIMGARVGGIAPALLADVDYTDERG